MCLQPPLLPSHSEHESRTGKPPRRELRGSPSRSGEDGAQGSWVKLRLLSLRPTVPAAAVPACLLQLVALLHGNTHAQDREELPVWVGQPC